MKLSFACSLAALAALASSGCCAVSEEAVHRSLDPAPRKAAAVKSAASAGPARTEAVRVAPTAAAPAEDGGRQWCQSRYIESASGQRPGGAETVEEKRKGDAYCAQKGIGVVR
jgi:hypothetical protein